MLKPFLLLCPMFNEQISWFDNYRESLWNSDLFQDCDSLVLHAAPFGPLPQNLLKKYLDKLTFVVEAALPCHFVEKI